ncbi:alpha-amylase family glycosyl hydrolase [Lactiplantibacillus plantarum]|mgnify:CR=1 FL=1|uniref:alpha-amylase family glycosyl hydrolase n=1 Tax=Lactiplantibacillus plantarum TaxID=1590 RepID=UPI000408A362|nr:hypothetical protein LpLQ80_15660 [Lactiplantibacillus plantarum]MCG0690989.1 Oligo-1,6-glucosidase [Lactiplantibacillus plantarum]MCG0942314.1 Oligo-1,6-glucosidase [Lactiplantibacillus plantarum]NGM26394.1 hypothetical protein [Lactiplantibacillus plantarum]
MKNSEVRQAVFDIERFWLDKGVDGFKTDFINLISKPVNYQTFHEEHPSQERIKTFINEEVRNKNRWAKSAIQMYQMVLNEQLLRIQQLEELSTMKENFLNKVSKKASEQLDNLKNHTKLKRKRLKLLNFV